MAKGETGQNGINGEKPEFAFMVAAIAVGGLSFVLAGTGCRLTSLPAPFFVARGLTRAFVFFDARRRDGKRALPARFFPAGCVFSTLAMIANLSNAYSQHAAVRYVP
jgi:hypothetical protein